MPAPLQALLRRHSRLFQPRDFPSQSGSALPKGPGAAEGAAGLCPRRLTERSVFTGRKGISAGKSLSSCAALGIAESGTTQACQSSRSARTTLSDTRRDGWGCPVPGERWTRCPCGSSSPGHSRFLTPPSCANGACAAPLRPPPAADGTAPRLRAPERRPAPPTTASRWRRLRHAQRLGGFSCPGPPAWCERPERRSG